jgi:hypothetical protein
MCGSGLSEIFVDGLWFYGWSFYSPCAGHDACYGCQGQQEGKSKSDCDNAFYQQMMRECAKLAGNSYQRNNCEGTAYGYHWAVTRFGGGAFERGRESCGSPCK